MNHGRNFLLRALISRFPFHPLLRGFLVIRKVTGWLWPLKAAQELLVRGEQE